MTPSAATDTPLRVLVIDDHRVFTDLLAFALDAAADTVCVGTAATLVEGLRKAEALSVDVIVLDVSIGDDDGVTAIPDLRERCPGARILVLTAHPIAAGADAARALGACGYLAKDTRLDDLLVALRTATAARPAVAPGLVRTPVDDLTPREREVLTLLCEGRRPADIARHLSLSPHTVRDHVKTLRRSLGVRSQLEVVARARALGLGARGGR
ncbi:MULTISPECIES: response regulator transcription factor [Microbacterium]|uniref:response regulator n=1 Tax=Microbacterium TaxID=33882 RepID=UPI00278601F0|nr:MULTISPECIES: response regulator transcription factor [Microbacterium]MDQ1083950.1 DNA-binding NarL/FixJ family response regulator [Microbacterium sp. SORGH_AS_0344]MDQ1170771.1 DNA-binding NarL/FixJ family response regulator [Microbacterium proteolyticum]